MIKTKSKNLSICEKRILDNFDVFTIVDYINLIKFNINDDERMTEIINKYNIKKNNRLLLQQEKEKEEFNQIIKNSIKISSTNNIISIKLLTYDDNKKAIELYQKFKIIINEDIENIEDYIEDFILKNLIFGIFKYDELLGFVIIDYSKKFNIGEKYLLSIFNHYLLMKNIEIMDMQIY